MGFQLFLNNREESFNKNKTTFSVIIDISHQNKVSINVPHAYYIKNREIEQILFVYINDDGE